MNTSPEIIQLRSDVAWWKSMIRCGALNGDMTKDERAAYERELVAATFGLISDTPAAAIVDGVNALLCELLGKVAK